MTFKVTVKKSNGRTINLGVSPTVEAAEHKAEKFLTNDMDMCIISNRG